MEKRKTKGFLAMLLALAMIITLLPAQAFATDISVAEIGSTKYETLAAAVSAAQEGDTIKLIGDETITSTLTIGKDLTLDLNGQTLTMTVTSGMTGAVYVNSHSLTIQDSSDGQAGRIDITSNSGNGAYGFYLSGSGSSLSIESGSITATNYYNSNGSYFSQKAIYAVYVSSGTSFTMSGGSLTASNANNSGKAAWAVYVSGGTANITGGSIIVDDHDTYGWADDHLVYKSSGTVNITGGKFKSPKQLDFNGITSKLTGSYMLAAADDDGYRAVVSAVAQIGSEKYTTLAEAIAAVPTNGTETTITMIANEVLSSGVTIVAGQNIVLELNGKIVSESLSQSGTTALITNRGTLTIQDNTDTDKDGTGTGKITYFNGLPDPAAIPGYASNTIANNGTLTIESGLVENTTNGGYAAYTVDNLTNGGLYTPVFTMNGGRLYNNYTDAVRMFLNSNTNLNKVVINGGVLDSDKASGRVIVIHNPNSKVNKGELDITGGTINGKVNGWSAANAGGVEDRFSDAQYAEIAINISGGNIGALSFAEMANETLRAQALQVTGGKYKADPTAYVTEGYKAVAIDEDPYFFEVVPATYVAQIGNVKYTTLAEAFAAVQEGQTITLLADTETGETYTHDNPLVLNTDNVTLDLGGNTLTITSNMSLVVRSDNGVVTNGTIVPGITDTKVTNWCRYGLTIDDCDGVTISDIVSQTGIAIGGDPDDNYTPGAAPATNVTISDCTVTGRTSRYAVFAQNFSTATITGGTYNAASATAGVLYAAFSATDGNPGVINITGGKFLGTITQNNAGSIIIKGGEYSKTPAAFVADGYEVTDNADATYPFAVEKVKVYVAQIGEEKYEKLSDAILALKDGDTLTLLGDYDFVANEGYEYYWIDDGGNKPYNKNNQLEIAANNVTINLNGHEITNLMNNSICIGANASGTTYQNITIKDGSLKVGIDDYARKDNKLYSYVVSVRHAEGVKFENLTTLGGINVTDGSVVEIDGLTFEGTKFYAVCSQEGADITLKNGDFSKYEEGSANTLFWVQAGSSMSIYGGTYSLTGTTKFENAADPVLYGGIYNFNPAAYVANGYKAVAIGEGLYQVGVIEATATQEGSVQDNEVTFSVGSVVKDADEEVITGSAEVAQSITLTGTFEYDYEGIVTDDNSKTAVGAANLAQFDEAQLPDIVAAAYVEAGDQADDIKDVKIVVVSDGVTEGTSTGGLPTLTYEVHPEAITYNAGGEAINSVAIANSQLGSEAVFSIKLPVSDALYSEAVDTDGYRYVSVTHVSSDEGYEDEVGYFRIMGTAGSYYIICDVTHFSEFELEPVVVANVAGVKVQASITLQDDIKINFYVNGLDDDKYVGDYKVRYTYNGVTTEVRLDEVSPGANGYKFVVAECAARQMNDTVDFRVFYQDTEIFRTPDYSIRVYCEKQLAKSNINAKLRNICLAVLDYGAAAQNYFGYQKSNLANATYTAGTVASTVVPVYVAEATWGGAVSKVTASLSLKSRTELNFYIYSASDIYDEVTVTVGGSTWTNYTYEYLGVNDGLKIYKLTVKGIASGLLGQNVSFEIGGIASATYSPMSYAYRNQNKGAGLGNVCKALYNYYVAASAYFN
ncbi:MAG: hypothetical protein IKR26_00520 [Lachnospiraceae bacterium]|nr:hypothetical protein [Lachnospiraceae bacterium]